MIIRLFIFLDVFSIYRRHVNYLPNKVHIYRYIYTCYMLLFWQSAQDTPDYSGAIRDTHWQTLYIRCRTLSLCVQYDNYSQGEPMRNYRSRFSRARAINALIRRRDDEYIYVWRGGGIAWFLIYSQQRGGDCVIPTFLAAALLLLRLSRARFRIKILRDFFFFFARVGVFFLFLLRGERDWSQIWEHRNEIPRAGNYIRVFLFFIKTRNPA